ncbi:MAG: hypothetical protein JW969_06980 [Spirochaetales bacterium]|nr:hypothetical protein [Spirochaetales bacterium]
MSGNYRLKVLITGLDDYMKFRLKGCFSHYDCHFEFIDDSLEAFNRAVMLKNTDKKIDVFIYSDNFQSWMLKWGVKLQPCSIWKLSIDRLNLNLTSYNKPEKTISLKKDEILTNTICEKMNTVFSNQYSHV